MSMDKETKRATTIVIVLDSLRKVIRFICGVCFLLPFMFIVIGLFNGSFLGVFYTFNQSGEPEVNSLEVLWSLSRPMIILFYCSLPLMFYVFVSWFMDDLMDGWFQGLVNEAKELRRKEKEEKESMS